MKTNNWIAAGALLASSMAANAGYIANFDTGPDGWGGAGGVPNFTYQSTGGIGDSGYIREVDVAGGQMLAVVSGLGNLSSTLGGTFSFDYNVFGLESGNPYIPNYPFGSVTLHSGSSYVTGDIVPNITSDISGTGWHFATRNLSAGLWSGNATLSSVLSNVTMVTVDLEYNYTTRWPDEIVGLDNVSFAPRGGTVPEPETLALFAIGLAAVGIRSRRRRA